MNRRKLLAFIGLAPFVPFAARAAPAQTLMLFVSNYTREVYHGGFPVFAQFEPDRLVCENHRDKAWPEECDCGPGMRYGDGHKS